MRGEVGWTDICEPALTGMLLGSGMLPPVLQVMSAVVKSYSHACYQHCLDTGDGREHTYRDGPIVFERPRVPHGLGRDVWVCERLPRRVRYAAGNDGFQVPVGEGARG